jgi:hypothetical protein
MDWDNTFALARIADALNRNTVFNEAGKVRIYLTRTADYEVKLTIEGLAEIPESLKATLSDPDMVGLFKNKLRHNRPMEFTIPIEKRAGRLQVVNPSFTDGRSLYWDI